MLVASKNPAAPHHNVAHHRLYTVSIKLWQRIPDLSTATSSAEVLAKQLIGTCAHGIERHHILSRSSRFLAAVLVEQQSALAEKGAVLTETRAENGKNRPSQAITVVQAYLEYLNPTSFSVARPVSSMFSYHLSSIFGLFTIFQGSAETVQGHFCTFPIKICLLRAILVGH